MEDKKLLALIKKAVKRDRKAFESLCELKGREVVFLCVRALGNMQDGEDAAQEVFIKMQKSIPFLKEPKAFNVWLNRLVFSTCSNYRRDNAKQKGELNIDDIDAVLQTELLEDIPQLYIEKEDKRQALLDMIDALQPKYRDCVILHYYQGLSYPQIAEVLEISRSSVDNNLRMARRILKLEIENDMELSFTGAAVPVVAFGAGLSSSLHMSASSTIPTYLIKGCLAGAGVLGAGAAAAVGGSLLAVKGVQIAAIAMALAVGSASIGYASYQISRGSDPAASLQQQLQNGGKNPSPVDHTLLAPVGHNIFTGHICLNNSESLAPDAKNGLSGVRLELINADYPDLVIQETQTAVGDNQGDFTFSGFGPGRYKIRVYLPKNAVVTDAGPYPLQMDAKHENVAWLVAAFASDGQFLYEAEQTGLEGGSLEDPAADTSGDAGESQGAVWKNEDGGLEEIEPEYSQLVFVYPGDNMEFNPATIELEIPTPVEGNVELIGGKKVSASEYAEFINGLMVELYDPQGVKISTTAVEIDGSYSFDKPMVSQSGIYTICIVQKSEFEIPFLQESLEVYMQPGQGYTG